MKYQAEMLAQVLRMALARAEDLEKAVPQEKAHLDSEVVLLRREIQAVLRQAVALQQLSYSDLPPQEPLSLGFPEELLGQMAEVSRQAVARMAQQALAEVEAKAEVLPPQQVQAQLQEQE